MSPPLSGSSEVRTFLLNHSISARPARSFGGGQRFRIDFCLLSSRKYLSRVATDARSRVYRPSPFTTEAYPLSFDPRSTTRNRPLVGRSLPPVESLRRASDAIQFATPPGDRCVMARYLFHTARLLLKMDPLSVFGHPSEHYHVA